jgi:hypothetical protein
MLYQDELEDLYCYQILNRPRNIYKTVLCAKREVHLTSLGVLAIFYAELLINQNFIKTKGRSMLYLGGFHCYDELTVLSK